MSLLRSYHQYAACSNCSPWKENIRFDEKCKFGYSVVIKFSLVTSHSVCLDVSQEMALSNFHKMWSRGQLPKKNISQKHVDFLLDSNSTLPGKLKSV